MRNVERKAKRRRLRTWGFETLVRIARDRERQKVGRRGRKSSGLLQQVGRTVGTP